MSYRVIVPKQSAIDFSRSLSPRGTGDTGDDGPFTGDAPVMTGDGPVMAGVLAHHLVQHALELFDGEVTQVRLPQPQEASRAA